MLGSDFLWLWPLPLRTLVLTLYNTDGCITRAYTLSFQQKVSVLCTAAFLELDGGDRYLKWMSKHCKCHSTSPPGTQSLNGSLENIRQHKQRTPRSHHDCSVPRHRRLINVWLWVLPIATGKRWRLSWCCCPTSGRWYKSARRLQALREAALCFCSTCRFLWLIQFWTVRWEIKPTPEGSALKGTGNWS